LQGIDRRLIQNFEWPLPVMGLLLAVVGIINLISAAPGAVEQGMPPTAMRQLAWLGVGFVGMLAVLLPDYRVLERMALPIFAACCVLLVLVLATAPVINGSQRWLVLGGMRLWPRRGLLDWMAEAALRGARTYTAGRADRRAAARERAAHRAARKAAG